MYPKKIMMITPDHFRLEYVINPHMKLANQVNKQNAIAQWNQLKAIYENLGLEILIVEGDERFPDMVFCANPFFSYPEGVLLSQMRFEQRMGEVDIYANYLKTNKRAMGFLEGNGDLIWNYETMEIYAGYGFRSDATLFDEISKDIGYPLYPLELVSENFYHLDTCLCVLNKMTAAVVKSALTHDGLIFLQSKFSDIIWVDEHEAKNYLAANALSVDGINVVVEKNAVKLQKELLKRGFKLHLVDTSEFLKAGGSIFCMKHLIF